MRPKIKNQNIFIRNCVFAFKCSADWANMKVVSEDALHEQEIRFCESCQKEVHYCGDDDELATNIRLNRCIAIGNEGIPLKMTLGVPVRPKK
jgi:hypothetical protein